MKKSVLVLGFTFAGLGFLATQAVAGPTGSLSTANCAGSGVTVTNTTVAFQGNCIQSGSGTGVSTSFGNLIPGAAGTIANLPVTPGSDPFMVFVVGGIDLNFFLSGVGPGMNNTNCLATFDPNDPSCSLFTGSPFVLTPGPGGTTVRLAAHGTVSDATGMSSWNGTFSVNFANMTPLDVKDQFFQSGTMGGATFDGAFALTPLPEPATISMLGLGLLGVGLFGRRKIRK